MIFPKKCLGCPPFLGYICWPKVVGTLLLLSAPLALLSFRRPCLVTYLHRRVTIYCRALHLYNFCRSPWAVMVEQLGFRGASVEKHWSRLNMDPKLVPQLQSYNNETPNYPAGFFATLYISFCSFSFLKRSRITFVNARGSEV